MSLSRLTLPANFQDQISRRMLTAPVPEFFWNRLLDLASTQFDLQSVPASAMGLSPDRAPVDQGASVADIAQLQLMVNDNSGQAAVWLVSDELAADGQGHTIRFNRPVFSGAGYSISARRTAAGQQISTTPIDLSMESTYLTLERLNGPYDSANTRIAPYAIDRRDSKRSIFSLAQLAAQNLKYDRAKLTDSVVNALVDAITASTINSSLNAVFPGRGRKTAKAQLLAPGDAEMDLETLLRAERTLVNRNVRRLPNGKYMAVLTPQQAMQLLLDADFREYAKTGQSPDSKNPLFQSQVFELPSISIYRSTTLTVDTSTVAGNSIQQGVMLGAEALGYGRGEDVNVATSSADNFGNQALFIWQSMEAFGVLNNSYGVGVFSD